MTKPRLDVLEQNMASIIALAMELGVYVEVGSDFNDFVDLCSRTSTKGDVSPAFNPAKTGVDGKTGIWMTGRNANGEVVYTQAVKLLPMKGRNLKDYLKQHLGDIRIGGMDVDVPNSPIALSDATARVCGKVTYHGEVWMTADLRGGCLTIILSRLILIMAYLRWDPDFMIGIQAIKTCCRGLGIRQGYARNQPGFVNWKIHGRDDPIEGWLVWMNGEEASYNLSVPPRRFHEVFEPQAAPETENVPIKRQALGR